MTWPNRIARALPLVLRVALGAVWIFAAWMKLRYPWQLFAAEIGDYKVLPEGAVVPLAHALPWAELLLGALLVFGVFLRAASAASSLILAGFLTLMVRAMILHMQISCGCFGPGDLISWRTLLRDGSLLALSLAVAWLAFARRRRKTPPQPAITGA